MLADPEDCPETTAHMAPIHIAIVTRKALMQTSEATS